MRLLVFGRDVFVGLAGNCGYPCRTRKCTNLLVFGFVVVTCVLGSLGRLAGNCGYPCKSSKCTKLFVFDIVVVTSVLGSFGRLAGNCGYPCKPSQSTRLFVIVFFSSSDHKHRARF